MNTFATTITVALLAALFAGSALPPALAQIHQHQHEKITATAKKLNERFDADAKHWAGQFESPGRTIFDRRMEIVDLLALKPGMDVADVGAGSGLFSRLIAQRVGSAGTVYAIEISASLVDHITRTATTMGLQNVRAVLGDPKSPRLPAQSVDVIFIADSYHHFEYPREMLQGIKKALRPDGYFLLIDFNRIEGVSHPFLLEMVRAGKETFTDEIRNAGFELVEDIDMFEDEYVLRFKHK